MSTQVAPQVASEDDDQTLSAIRSVLIEPIEPEELCATIAEPAAESAPEATPVAGPRQAPEVASRVESVAPEPEVLSKPGLIDRIRGITYRPSRRLMIWAAIALLVFLFPHVFIIGAVVLLFVTGSAFAIFGSEAVWGFGMRGFARYGRVAPAQAARFATRMDAFALRWDAFLDRFPDGSVDGLYLPDFQALSKADEQHTAVMSERLARMQSGAEA